MFLRVFGTVAEPLLEVREVENLKALHVAAPKSWSESQIAAALQADAWAGPVSEGHAWLDISTLRRRAGASENAQWAEQFDAMITYAAGKGWCDESRALVRAHLEYW